MKQQLPDLNDSRFGSDICVYIYLYIYRDCIYGILKCAACIQLSVSVRGLPDGLLHQLQCGLGGSGRGHVMSGFVCEQFRDGRVVLGIGMGDGVQGYCYAGKARGRGGSSNIFLSFKFRMEANRHT